MKAMQIYLITLLIILFSLVSNIARAQSLAASEYEIKMPMTQKGNLEFGGGFGMSYNSDEEVEFEISPKLEFFLFDQLSFGGFASQGSSESVNTLSMGPSMSYYFLNFNSMGLHFYANQSFAIQQRESRLTEDSKLTESLLLGETSLGLKYFFLPSLAFGAAIHYRYGLSSTRSPLSPWVSKSFLSFYF